jgi:hypothetical protein
MNAISPRQDARSPETRPAAHTLIALFRPSSWFHLARGDHPLGERTRTAPATAAFLRGLGPVTRSTRAASPRLRDSVRATTRPQRRSTVPAAGRISCCRTTRVASARPGCKPERRVPGEPKCAARAHRPLCCARSRPFTGSEGDLDQCGLSHGELAPELLDHSPTAGALWALCPIAYPFSATAINP